MAATDTMFTGAIPELYDRYLVPMIFEPYAVDLAARISALSPGAVLEIAAGTGVLTRALAARLAADARLVATDLNPAMLDHARKRQPARAAVEWQQADALVLPFGDGEFDVVACQFGAMFFPDKPKAYREAKRVLKPGGHLLFSVWDRLSENEFTQVMSDVLAEIFDADPPRFMERIPHGYFAADAIRAGLGAAGFSDVSIVELERTSRAASARDVAVALCQGTPVRNEIEARDPERLDEATRRVEEAVARRFGDGAIEGRIKALVVTTMRTAGS